MSRWEWGFEEIVFVLLLLLFLLLVLLAIGALMDSYKRRREIEDRQARVEGIIRRYEDSFTRRWDDGDD